MKTVRLTGLSKVILLIAAIFLAMGFFSTNALASGEANKAHFHYVTISSGQTLWSLASKYAKNTDPRDWIASVVDLNNLNTNNLQPGQRLALPN